MQSQGDGRGCLGAVLGIVVFVVSAFFLSPLVGFLTVIGVGLAGLVVSSLPEVDDGIIRGLSVAVFGQYALLFLSNLADGSIVPHRLAGSSIGTAVCCLVMFGVFGATQKRD
ncbi:hypothetical protein ACFV2N_44730 [Streptomyces sp. NPDC059680]|uniref:hypothetical protein n=1 Tax=Streptomyces sp. NPDC059680 TaxID=3346904 RepID=UPI00369458DF